MGFYTVLLVTIPVIFLVSLLFRKRRSTPYEKYPGLHGRSGKMLSMYYVMTKGVWNFVMYLYEKYKSSDYRPIHFTTMMGNPALFIYNPDHIIQALTDIDHFEWTSERETVEHVGRLLPDAIITTWDYKEWHPKRARIVYYLSGRALEKAKEFSIRCARENFLPELKKIADGRAVDLGPIIFRYATLSTLMEMFDLKREDIPDQTLDHITKLFSYIWKRIFNPLILLRMKMDNMMPFLGLEKEYKEDVRAFYDLLAPHQERLRYADTLGGSTVRGHTKFNPNFKSAAVFAKSILNIEEAELEQQMKDHYAGLEKERDDLHHVSFYLAGKLKLPEDQLGKFAGHLSDGNPIDLQKVVNETLTLMLGGAETNAIFFQWILLHMSATPATQQRVYEELKDKELVPMPERKGLINNIVQEVFRLSGPTYYSQRGCHTKTILQPGNFEVPAGTIMTFSQLLQSTLEENFPDALKFDPDRWAQEMKPKAGTFLPFVKGRRTCPGAEQAQFEAALFITVLFQNFRIERADDKEIGKLCGLTVMPDPPIMLKIKAV